MNSRKKWIIGVTVAIINTVLILSWDQEFAKSKLQMDPLLKRNVIHGGKMSVSQKTINQITFRQNAYNVWVSHQELD